MSARASSFDRRRSSFVIFLEFALMLFNSSSLQLARRVSNSTSSACEGVRPDVCGCGLRGRPVGSRKRRLFVFPVPWTAGWMPVWMTGVEERGVVSSRSAANKGEEMSGRVRLDGGLCRATKSTLGVGNVSLTGPPRPNEITSGELLLPRRSPSNSASREFRLRGTCPTM